jgi:hypothetical protein
LEAARLAVMAKLKVKAEYKALLTQETAAAAKLQQLRDNGASKDAILVQSKKKLELGGAASKMEREAMEADPTYVEAKKKLADATALLKDQKDKNLAAINSDANIMTLRQSQTDTNAKLADAQYKLKVDYASAAGLPAPPPQAPPVAPHPTPSAPPPAASAPAPAGG